VRAKLRHNAQPLDGRQKAAVIIAVVVLGLGLAFAATVIAGITGVASGYVLAKGRFPGRDVLETVGSLPIILPPTVVGYYLLEVLAPGTRIGDFLTRTVGHVLVYNATGCVIAATVAAFPFCMRAARAAIEGVDPAFEQAARTMGVSNWRVALWVTLPLARRGIAAGLTIGCARALGEYGATLMVGGDINGKTRTLSLAILDTFTTPERNTMLLILVLMAITAMTGVALLGRNRA
jgi:molybdate transport system permease protein